MKQFLRFIILFILVNSIALANFSIPIGPSFASDRVIVKFKPNTGPISKTKLISSYGLKRKQLISELGLEILTITQEQNPYSLAQKISKEPTVLYAQPDYTLTTDQTAITPNDPWYPTIYQWELRQINCQYAWAITTGISAIVVGVIDTGIYTANPDLTNQVITGWNATDNSTNTSDTNGHGTNVAGVIAAQSNNGIGVASVAWNCKLIPLKVDNSSGIIYESAVNSALTFAANHGIRIANMSLGGVVDSAFLDAVSYYHSKGGVLVQGSGNTGSNTGLPANPNIIGVSATDSNNTITSYSCYGNNIDICAPGDASTTWNTPSTWFAHASGTSIATPYISGVAALVLSVNPSLTADQITNILTSTATDLGTIGWDQYYGYGLVNAYAAVVAAQSVQPPPPPPVDTIAPTVSITSPADGTTITKNGLTVTVNTADNVGVTKVELYLDNAKVASSSVAPFTTSYPYTKIKSGSHTIYCKAYDAAGNSGISLAITIKK